MALAGVTARVTDSGGTNLVEIDMLVDADAATDAVTESARRSAETCSPPSLQERSLRTAWPEDGR